MRVIEKAARSMGVQNLKVLLFGAYRLFAFRQLEKGLTAEKVKEFPKQVMYVVKNFYPKLSRIINNPELRANGFVCELWREAADRPFNLHFELKKQGMLAAKFNFDLFFMKGKPSAYLGNFQGGRKEFIEEFKAKIGKPVLNFFAGAFKKEFPGETQLIALNPKFHQYSRPLNERVVASSMQYRGKLSEKEYNAFRDYLHLGKKTKTALNVSEKVNDEIARIRSSLTGMHKSAFKKAGFKKAKGKHWRLFEMKKPR